MADYLTGWDKDVENPAVDRMELYNKLLTRFNEQGQTDAEKCWRLVVICLILSDLQLKNKNKSEAKKWEEEAFKYAKKALELDPKSMNVHKWYGFFLSTDLNFHLISFFLKKSQ